MAEELGFQDRPHKTERILGPYAGIIPPERVIIDGFNRNSYWYVTDNKDLVEIVNHKILPWAREDGSYNTGLQEISDGQNQRTVYVV